MNLKQLEAFRALMLTGTTTRAAKVLHLGQPAVSRLIRDLEAQLDVPLFERQRGRLVPTRHAAWLFSEAEETLSHLDKLDNAIRNAPQSPSRPFRLVANSAMAFSVLPAAVAAFRKHYPSVTILTDIVMRRDNRRWINDQSFDLAVTMLPIEYPEESVRALTRVPAVCIMPRDHSLARLAAIRPHDLDGVPMVALPPDNLTPARLNSLFQQKGLHLNLVVEAQTVIAVSAYVAEGLGVGIVDPYTARRFQPLGVIERPFISPIDYLFGVVFPLRKPRSPMTDLLVGMIETEMSTDGFAAQSPQSGPDP